MSQEDGIVAALFAAAMGASGGQAEAGGDGLWQAFLARLAEATQADAALLAGRSQRRRAVPLRRLQAARRLLRQVTLPSPGTVYPRDLPLRATGMTCGHLRGHGRRELHLMDIKGLGANPGKLRLQPRGAGRSRGGRVLRSSPAASPARCSGRASALRSCDGGLRRCPSHRALPSRERGRAAADAPAASGLVRRFTAGRITVSSGR